MRPGRVLGAWVYFAGSVAFGSEPVPFTSLPTLGGPIHQGFRYGRFVGQSVDSSWFSRLSQLSASLLGAVGPTMAATRLGNAAFINKHFPLSSAPVTASLGDAPLADNYLASFGGMTIAQLRDVAPPPSPVPRPSPATTSRNAGWTASTPSANSTRSRPPRCRRTTRAA